jgi:hypothetical protein
MPLILTVDGETAAMSSWVSSMFVGGGPTSGAGRMASNTRGNWSSPTRRRRATSASGGCGRSRSTPRAITELRACPAKAPGTSAIVGRRSHTAMTMPRMPATAPKAWSTMAHSVLGRFTRMREPTTTPRACPRNEPTRRTMPPSSSRLAGLSWRNCSTSHGSDRADTNRPRPMPTQDAVLVRKPRR